MKGLAVTVNQNISLNGNWKFKQANLVSANLFSPIESDILWDSISVPANWYSKGFDIYGEVWYRKHFFVDNILKGNRIILNFKGVDYFTDVWINGSYVGNHEGYFQSFSFDITDFIQFDKENLISVKVNSPIEDPLKDWSLNKKLIKGIYSHHDTRPGGAWSPKGQERNTGGIWNDVYLEIENDIHIDSHIYFNDVDLKSKEGLIKSIINISNNRMEDESLEFVWTIESISNESSTDKIVFVERKTCKKGETKLEFNFSVPDVKLWHSWDYGSTNLYKITLELKSKDVIIDNNIETIAFRKIQYDKIKKVWLLNGKRIFLRGTNYISSQMLSEMTPEKYIDDITLIKKANINIIRVHAHIERQEFYDLCDKAGIMIWQDFPLQWGYTDDTTFIKNATSQAKDMVNQFSSHPSIIVWSMHNEPPWDADWMVYKYENYNPEQNRILDAVLFETVNKLDSTRIVHLASTTKEHPWYGWYSGTIKDYSKKAKIDLITEFGAQALPDLASLRKIFNENELYPETQKAWDKWDYHNFQRKETFELAKVEKGKNISEFINNTQKYQSELTKFAAESYRRQKYNPVSALFQFMFVECWESVNWGIVDYWRNPKPGYYALQQAFQPILPGIFSEFKDNALKVEIWAVNDLWESYPDSKLEYTIKCNDEIIETNSIPFDLNADSVKEIIKINKKEPTKGSYEIVAKIFDSKKKVLSINNNYLILK